MPIIISGQKDYKGLFLSKPFCHEGSLVVLTGKNGCGKTRLLESIQNSSSTANIGKEQLESKDILFVAQDKLTPNFEGKYVDSKFQTKITSTLELFDRVKKDFDSPFDIDKARVQGRMLEDSLPYESLYYLCSSIANHLEKAASELTHDEIRIHFEDHISTIFGLQNISTISSVRLSIE